VPASPIDFDGGGSGISCEAIVHAVAKRGFRRLLMEADAYTVSRFSKEGQRDRLHIQLEPRRSADALAWRWRGADRLSASQIG
jgi:riboflavin biosynthesis pyrimidine reductase